VIKMLKGLNFLVLLFLFPAVASAYSINWIVLESCVTTFDSNIWDGSSVSKKMILDRLAFLEDGDKDNERLEKYTTDSFTALVEEAQGLLTTSPKQNPLFNEFITECKSIYTEGDDKIKKSIHLVLEKMVKEAKDKLQWWSKVGAVTTAKPVDEKGESKMPPSGSGGSATRDSFF
jgi:hypothetical protein